MNKHLTCQQILLNCFTLCFRANNYDLSIDQNNRFGNNRAALTVTIMLANATGNRYTLNAEKHVQPTVGVIFAPHGQLHIHK